MRYPAALVFALVVFVAPTLAAAETPTEFHIRQLTAAVAALEAQMAALQTGQSLACAAVFSKPSVAVGEDVALAWGSVGAMLPSSTSTVPMWAQHGTSDIVLQQPGTWTYRFIFYSASGASTTCAAEIVALAK